MTLSELEVARSQSLVTIEERKKILEQYLQDLALIPSVKESTQFKAFL